MAAVEKYVNTFMSRLPPDLKAKVMKNPKVAAKILADVATKGKLVKEEIEEGLLELEDGEVVDVSADDAESFNEVLESLNPENRTLMLTRMVEDKETYDEMLNFARGDV